MKKNIPLLILMLFLLAQIVFAANHELAVKEGNQLYTANQFEEAIKKYEAVLKDGVASHELYYNLGNAYYKINDFPSAILNYERAKKLAPGDEDVEFNLKLANLRITDKIQPASEFVLKGWLATFANSRPIDSWALYCVISLSVAVLFLVAMFLMSSPFLKKINFLLFVVCFAYATFCFVVGTYQHNYLRAQNDAIVFTPSVTVKSSPDENGTKLFVIHSGTKISIKESSGTWTKISLANGNLGWIKTDTFQKI